MMRLAVVVSHPIQHFCPQYNSWAKSGFCELKVIFETDLGLKPFVDPGFGKQIKWDALRLNFDHVFLRKLDEAEKRTSRSLQTELRVFKPDAVLHYGYMKEISLNALQWAKANGTKALGFSDAENHSFRPLWKRLLKYFPIKSYLKQLDLILTTGDANEAYYRKYGACDLQFLRCPYPIDMSYLDQVWDSRHLYRKRIREGYNITDSSLVLSCVGKLVNKKRQADLIACVSILEKYFPDIVAFVIGSGPDRADLEKRARSLLTGKVIFTDFIQPEEMFEILCATDVYVHASSLEPHSVAVSEAVFLGCPVVISDKCGSYGPTDDVQSGMNGFVYPCGNIQNMADNIRVIASCPELKERFSTHSREHGVRSQRLSHHDALGGISAAFGFWKGNGNDKS
jgi:glycosyltransferase involved in cell wall biosynthesis